MISTGHHREERLIRSHEAKPWRDGVILLFINYLYVLIGFLTPVEMTKGRCFKALTDNYQRCVKKNTLKYDILIFYNEPQ